MPDARRNLGHGAWLDYLPGLLDTPSAGEMRRILTGEVQWEEREILIFGKRILQPRLVAWAGQVPYRYSGQTLAPRPCTATVASVLARVCTRTSVSFNHVLLNRYRNGQDSMGFHSDDEPELGNEPVVATLSLGAARRFSVRGRRPDAESFDMMLESGSLLVMGGTFQNRYRHGLPRDRSCVEERISLTFRVVSPRS